MAVVTASLESDVDSTAGALSTSFMGCTRKGTLQHPFSATSTLADLSCLRRRLAKSTFFKKSCSSIYCAGEQAVEKVKSG